MLDNIQANAYLAEAHSFHSNSNVTRSRKQTPDPSKLTLTRISNLWRAGKLSSLGGAHPRGRRRLIGLLVFGAVAAPSSAFAQQPCILGGSEYASAGSRPLPAASGCTVTLYLGSLNQALRENGTDNNLHVWAYTSSGGTLPEGVSVLLTLQDGAGAAGAIAGVDYVLPSPHPIRIDFPANLPSGGTVDVPIAVPNDTIPEPDKYFTAILSSPQNATLMDGIDRVRVNVLDNDRPQFAFTGSTSLVREDGTWVTPAGVPTDPPSIHLMTAEAPLQQIASVKYFTVDQGSAVANADYRPISTTLTFQPGEVDKHLPATGPASITIFQDTVREPGVGSWPGEAFQIAIQPEDAGPGEDVQYDTVYILDDDNVQVDGTMRLVSSVLTEGAPVSYVVVLTNTGPSPQLDEPTDEFSDTLPSSLALLSATATDGVVTPDIIQNVVRWNGGIASGSSVTITINATIRPGTTGQVASNQGIIRWDSESRGVSNATSYTRDTATGGVTAFQVQTGPLSVYLTVPSCRLVDTRGDSGVVYDGPELASGLERTFNVTGNCGVPADAKAVLVTMTAVQPIAEGYIRVRPADAPNIETSSINYVANRTIANNGIFQLGPGGGLMVLSSSTVHFLLDITGYLK